MPLTNKYLKYTPEITLEIFTLVWNKLESLFSEGIYDWTKDWSLESFKKHGYISIWGTEKYSFGINNNKGHGNDKETTVQEILGYNPFVKEENIQNRNNLKKGDYLYVLLSKYYGDILEITGIRDDSKYEEKYKENSIWITHKNGSFSGGGFRCSDKTYPMGKTFRLATKEEINQYLISTGQIPLKEPLNHDNESSKDLFKLTYLPED